MEENKTSLPAILHAEEVTLESRAKDVKDVKVTRRKSSKRVIGGDDDGAPAVPNRPSLTKIERAPTPHEVEMRDKAALKIQCIIRRFLAYNKYLVLRAKFNAEEFERKKTQLALSASEPKPSEYRRQSIAEVKTIGQSANTAIIAFILISSESGTPTNGLDRPVGKVDLTKFMATDVPGPKAYPPAAKSQPAVRIPSRSGSVSIERNQHAIN